MKFKAEIISLLALLCILAVAADLRLYRVDAVPGWYNDEGMLINLAENLLRGRVEYLGVQGSILFAARMPLFIWLLALAFRLFGTDISVLRALTAGIGVLNVALIYLILRRWGRPLALLCALAFAIFPKAVLYARIGFSYNLLAALVLLLFWSCNRYLDSGQRRWAAAGALILGLCLLAELAAAAYLPVFLIVILWKRWKDLWFALPLALILPLLYLAAMLLLSPRAYAADLQYALFRTSATGLPVQLVMVLLNAAMIHQDLFLLLGAAGLFLFPLAGLTRRLVLFLFLPLLVLARTVGVVPLGWHYLIPLFPFYAIGAGLLIVTFARAVVRFSREAFAQALIRARLRLSPAAARFLQPAADLVFIILLLIAPIAYLAATTHADIRAGALPTPVDPILVDPREARATVEFINARAGPGDLVLASPSIAWAMRADVTDYQIALAYLDLSTKFFPRDVAHERFRFDPSYQRAKFIVIDPVWRNWGEPNLPDLAAVRRYAEGFPAAFQTDTITVYEGR